MSNDALRNDGWLREAEDEAFLKEITRSRVPKAFRSWSAPKEVRPDKEPNMHRLENQSSMGSCQGHAIASCVEQLNTIATGGDRTQLSDIFAYLATQKIDGLLGSDRGSTISGGVKLATETGICPLALAPYPNPVRYPNSRDRQSILRQSNYAAGEPYKIRSSVGVKSYQDALDWIGGGGVISIGISWPPRFQTQNGRRIAVSGGGGGGGHAIAILGYRSNGNLIVANSHNYWFEFTPECFASVLKHRYTVAIGLNDMANPAPREFSWKTGKLSKLIEAAKNKESDQ